MSLFWNNKNKNSKEIVKKHKFSKKELAESPYEKSVILHLRLIKNSSGYTFDADSEIEIAKLLYWNNINGNTNEFDTMCSSYFDLCQNRIDGAHNISIQMQRAAMSYKDAHTNKSFKQFFDKVKSASLSKSDIIALLLENDRMKSYLSEIDSIISECKATHPRIENVENIIKNKYPELFLSPEELAVDLINKLDSADMGQAVPLSDKTAALLADKIDERRSNLLPLRTEILEYLADYEQHIPKYCSACGNQVSLSAKFCNQCGAKVPA